MPHNLERSVKNKSSSPRAVRQEQFARSDASFPLPVFYLGDEVTSFTAAPSCLK